MDFRLQTFQRRDLHVLKTTIYFAGPMFHQALNLFLQEKKIHFPFWKFHFLYSKF